MFGVRHPLALAPMGGSAGGALAAAVARGGGLGLLGGAYGDAQWLAREVPIAAGTEGPWGVGFLTWAIDVAAVERALAYGPTVVMLSFGDPGPYAERVRRAGARLIPRTSTAGAAGRPNSPPSPGPVRPTRTTWHAARSRRSPSGPARASTSSPTSRRRPT
jgi:nitronate monooxygenase